MNRRHGRHRMYFGNALSINILSEPARTDRERDRESDRSQQSDRARNPQESNRDR
jgi:hypothetical protein